MEGLVVSRAPLMNFNLHGEYNFSIEDLMRCDELDDDLDNTRCLIKSFKVRQ